MKTSLVHRVAMVYASAFEAPPRFLKSIQGFVLQTYAGHILARTQRRIEEVRGQGKSQDPKFLESYLRNLNLSSRFLEDWIYGNPVFKEEDYPPQSTFFELYPTGEGIHVTATRKKGVKAGMFSSMHGWRWLPTKGMELTYQMTDANQKPVGKVFTTHEDAVKAEQQIIKVLDKAIKDIKELLLLPPDSIVELVRLETHLMRYTKKAREQKTKVVFETPVDIGQWKYINDDHQEAQKKLDASLGTITVVLNFKGHLKRRGQWSFNKKLLEVDMPLDATTITEFDNNVARMLGITRHEAQHVGQDALSIIKDLRELGGLPRQRDPDANPYGTREDGKRTDHALRDAEFHTRLQDEIDNAVRGLQQIQKVDRRDVLRAWIAEKPNPSLASKYPKTTLDPKDFFSELKRHDRAKWKDAVKDYVSEVSRRIRM